MTNQNNAAQAANENPLSDEYVNAIIQRHGYDSPESVIAQLHQWIGLHGGEDSVTLLMYEAHKALSKLRAPVADERVELPPLSAIDAEPSPHGPYEVYESEYVKEYARSAVLADRQQRAALASAPVTVPHGWKLVPIKPTPEMEDAACDVPIPQDDSPAPSTVYAAMIGAAPIAPAASAPVATDNGAQLTPNRPESRASIESKGGALAPVAVEAQHDTDSACAWQVWWNQNKSRFTTTRQASFAAFAAGKDWHNAAPQGGECECSRKSKAVSDSEAQL